MIAISNFETRRDTVVSLLEILEKKEISNIDKNKIYNIVMNVNKKTDKQKDRFSRFYGIKPNQNRENLTSIAKSYGCTPSAVKDSIISLRIGLYRIPEDQFMILKEIYDKYSN